MKTFDFPHLKFQRPKRPGAGHYAMLMGSAITVLGPVANLPVAIPLPEMIYRTTTQISSHFHTYEHKDARMGGN